MTDLNNKAGPRVSNSKETTFPRALCFRQPTPPPSSATIRATPPSMAISSTSSAEMNAGTEADGNKTNTRVDASAVNSASGTAADNEVENVISSRASSVANSVASSNTSRASSYEPQMPNNMRKVLGSLRVQRRRELEKEKAARPMAGSARARRAEVMAKVQAQLQRQGGPSVARLSTQDEKLLGPTTRSSAPPVFLFGTDEHAEAQRIDREIMDALARARLADAKEEGDEASEDRELDQTPALSSLAQSVLGALNIKWDSIDDMRKELQNKEES